MKIAILTLPLNINYGGILQAYALQTVLQRMGHNVYVIDYDSMVPYSHPFWKMPEIYAKRIVKNLIGRRTPVFYEHKYRKEMPVIRQNTNAFINKYIKRLIITDFSQIKEGDFDAFIVGSDQVWRPKYFEWAFYSGIANAYLDFTKEWSVKRLSYAASFGVDCWEYNDEQTLICRELIKLFDKVSVRESSAMGLCAEKLEVDATHVLDPTMLLSCEDYMSLLDIKSIPTSKGELMTYILDDSPDKAELIKALSRITGYTHFNVRAKSYDFNDSIKDRIQPPVESWIRGFYDAKLVITDSFHACVFSILFKKPFVVVVNKERGASRFYSLLNMFGLGDRIVTSIDDVKDYHYSHPLPENVYERLDEMRKISKSFLSVLL